MRDEAAEKTDALLAKLEKKISSEYKGAYDAAEEKWQKFLSSFEKQDKIEAQRLADGEITKQQYQQWRIRQIANGKQYVEMRDVIAQDLHNSNLKAAKLANKSMADIYAVNANYGTYLVEKSGKINTGFTLYNHDTADALLKEEWKINPETGRNSFLPKPSAKKQKELAGLKSTNPDILWNSNKIQSAMFQGILLGEPLTDLAKRLASVAVMDEHQAIRNARTLTTNVQNKGRMDAFDRASKFGVELVDEWVAILDGRTRHSHRHMHGERRPHDSKKPFSNGCRWPGDPHAPAAEIYNCRCRMVSWVKGFEGETVKYNEAMGNMSFKEWQEEKRKKSDVSVDNTAETRYNGTVIEASIEGLYPEYSRIAGRKFGAESAIDNAEKTNPNFTTFEYEYTHNCQRCVPAWELRERGFDVLARPCKPENETDGLKTSCFSVWEYNMFDSDTSKRVQRDREGTGKEKIIDFLKQCGDGARVEILVDWDNGKDEGHAFAAKNIKGNILFVDPQSGATGTKVSDYFSRVKKGETRWLRIDQLSLRENIRNEVIKNPYE